MNCTKYQKPADAFTSMLPSLDDICRKLESYEQSLKICPFPTLQRSTRLSTTYEYDEQMQIIKFKCVKLAYYKSGDLVLRCINGTWRGEQPACELVDAEEKWFMMMVIILGCLSFAFIVLILDFLIWRYHRRVRREEIKHRKNHHIIHGNMLSPVESLEMLPSTSVDLSARYSTALKLLRASSESTITMKSNSKSDELNVSNDWHGKSKGEGLYKGKKQPHLSKHVTFDADSAHSGQEQSGFYFQHKQVI